MVGACNAVPVANRAPLSLQLAGLNPDCSQAANYPGLFPAVSSSTGTIQNALSNTNKIDSGIAKIDYHLSDKHSLSGMYEISPGRGLLNDAPAAQTNNIWLTNQYARSQVFAANWTWVPTSTWVNEFRVGYSHYFQDFEVADKAQNPATYSFNGSTYNFNTGQTNPLYFGFPVLTIGSFTGQLGGGGWPKVVGPNGVLQIMDHVSYLRGKHAFKYGGEILYNRSASDVTSNGRGSITFGSLQDFFTGVPDSSIDGGGTGGSAAILTGNLVRHFTYTGYAAFVQDDWRVKPRLTINLGLRYEITTVPKEANGLQGNFSPTQGLMQTNSPYAGDHNNFSPRFGFAWDMFGNGKTVLRGGGGLLYEQLSLDVFQGIGNSFGLRVEPTGDTRCAAGTCTAGPGTISVANVSLASNTLSLDGQSGKTAPASWTTAAAGSLANNWGLNAANGSIFPFVTACGDGNTVLTGTTITPSQCNAIEVDPKLRTPYVETWALDLQRALGGHLSLDIGYVGNHGVKLIGATEINQDPLTTLNVGAGVGTIVTGPGFTAAGLTACATAPIVAGKVVAGCKPSAAAEQSNRPYNNAFPYLKYIDYFGNLDTSNYNGLQAVLTARNYHGLTLTGGYTYAHSLGESSDQGTSGGLQIPQNSYGCFRCQLYTSTAFDMRHRFTISGTYQIPGKKGFAQMLQGWGINTTAVIQTGTPWGVNDTSTDFAGVGEANGRNPQANEGIQWDFFGNPNDFEAVHNFTGIDPTSGGTYTLCNSAKGITINCVGGAKGTVLTGIPFFPGGGGIATPTANATCNQKAANIGPLATASLDVLGCYALGNSVLIPPAYGSFGTMPRNPWRDQGFRNWDLSISKAFKFNERFSAQFRVEFFNVLNHVNFVNPFGGPGGAGTTNDINPSRASGGTGFGYVINTPDAASSNPILGSGGNRDMQLGLKLIF